MPLKKGPMTLDDLRELQSLVLGWHDRVVQQEAEETARATAIAAPSTKAKTQSSKRKAQKPMRPKQR